MKKVKKLTFVCMLMPLLLMLSSCASQKNTATTRWWKSFKSRYNTYFNGHQAYLEGMKTKVDGHKDNYTQTLPLMMVSNKASQSLGSGNFETTVTKCEKTIKLYSIKTKPVVKRGHRMTPKEKAFRNRQEYNPFLKNAWILMGKAQMEKGEFIEAASTFAYTERLYKDQPQVANIARSLMALCYAELDWYYDAEDLLRKVKRDSVPRAAARPYNTAMTDFFLRQKRFEEALPYLKTEVKNMPSGIPRARGYFLLGQVYQTLNKRQEAYKAMQRCMNQSPPYELKFNAQILQTEVMPQGSNQKKLAKLKRMARRVNNAKYLDQVYYAIGNVYLAQSDTVKAIEAYETGGKKATQNGPGKAQLMLRLGDLYWELERFGDAQRCYRMAITGLDKENDRYEPLTERNKVLDKLVPYTNEIHLQDSLQELVRMPEKDRNAAIDKIIAAVKEQQKAAKNAKADSLARASRNGRNGNTLPNQMNKNQNTANVNSGGIWYFYNQQTVSQGEEQFRKLWGDRQNEDHWRRSNKTVLTKTQEADEEDSEETPSDSLETNQDTGKKSSSKSRQNRKKEKDESTENGPLSRAYYLAQLPFTEEQLAESNKKLSEALFQAGIIEKDILESYYLCRKTLLRLYNNFPDFEPMDQLLYHLFLMELHWGSQAEADVYRNELAAKFPDSELTKLITSPDYIENARFGKHLEDSIYTATYQAYRTGDHATIKQNCQISAERFPKGINRAKFMFIEAMSHLQTGQAKAFADEMRDIAKNYTSDKISELAGQIVKGVDAGKIPIAQGFDFSSLWLGRESEAAIADSTLRADTLNAERNTDFLISLTYAPDSVDEGKLLYEVSRFNFTNFNVRNFDIEIIQNAGRCQMRVKGFISFDEVHRYEQELFQDSACKLQLEHVKPILISEHNLRLIEVKYSMKEYLDFYQQHFVPSKVKEDLKIDQNPDNFIWDEFQEVEEKEEEEEETEDIPIEDDGGEWY